MASVEKEATAIVEAVRKWSHLLLGRHFKLVTDQRSVSFMFNGSNRGKMKNAKVMRWRLELMQYSCDIVFRAGKHNTVPDTLSRVHCASISRSTLHGIHSSLCHPGVTRMFHYVRIKNLPYTFDEVRKMISSCRVCAEVKPRFHNSVETHLIKATQPMERFRTLRGLCLLLVKTNTFWLL